MAQLQRTSDSDLVRVELSGGDWARVKRRLGKDDERRRVRLTLRGQKVDPKARKVLGELDAGALYDEAVFATFEVALREWSIVDPLTGEIAEITSESIRAMADDDVKLLSVALNELYEPPLTEDQAKN